MINTKINYTYNIGIPTRAAAEAAYGKYVLTFYRELSMLLRSQYPQIGAPVVWENYGGLNLPANAETTMGHYSSGLSETFKITPYDDPSLAFYIKVEYVFTTSSSSTANSQQISPTVQVFIARTIAGLSNVTDIRMKLSAPTQVGYTTAPTATGVSGNWACALSKSFIGFSLLGPLSSIHGHISPLHNPITGLPTNQLICAVMNVSNEGYSFLPTDSYAYGRKIESQGNGNFSRATLIDVGGSSKGLFVSALSYGGYGDTTTMRVARTDPSGQETIIPGPYYIDIGGGRLWTTAAAGAAYLVLPSGAGGPNTVNVIGNYSYRCVDCRTFYGDNPHNQPINGWNDMYTWVRED